MSDRTGIEWTDATWNPWMGCTKVSPGCAHCYMFREQRQYGRDPEVVVRSKTKFAEPLKWKEPRRVFTCSWSDWFHEGADAWRGEAWDIIRRTPQHTYQVLTKRSERIADHLPADWGAGYPNVWLGVSVENQRFAHRAVDLMKVPAAIRFVSAEPLLGPVDLRDVRLTKTHRVDTIGQRYSDNDQYPGVFTSFGFASLLGPIHWVIAGGESGPQARPMDENWARDLRDQCIGGGQYGRAAFFLKQLGGWPNKRGGELAVLDGERWTQMPEGTTNV